MRKYIVIWLKHFTPCMFQALFHIENWDVSYGEDNLPYNCTISLQFQSFTLKWSNIVTGSNFSNSLHSQMLLNLFSPSKQLWLSYQLKDNPFLSFLFFRVMLFTVSMLGFLVLCCIWLKIPGTYQYLVYKFTLVCWILSWPPKYWFMSIRKLVATSFHLIWFDYERLIDVN